MVEDVTLPEVGGVFGCDTPTDGHRVGPGSRSVKPSKFNVVKDCEGVSRPVSRGRIDLVDGP